MQMTFEGIELEKTKSYSKVIEWLARAQAPHDATILNFQRFWSIDVMQTQHCFLLYDVSYRAKRIQEKETLLCVTF